MTQDEIAKLIGDTREVGDALQAFRKTAMFLSSQYPQLIERYPGQWIAMHSNEVRAHGDSLESVLRKIDEKGLSRDETVVRFMQKDPQTLIL